MGSLAGALTKAICCLTMFSLAAGQTTRNAAKHIDQLATAKAQLNSGDLAGADTTLLSFLSSQPDNLDALLLLGIVRGRQERFAEAEALFKRVLQSQGQSLIARRNLAFALLSQHKLSEAADQYELAIKATPDDVDLKVDCAQVRARLGDFQTALKLLNSIPANQMPRSALAVKAAALLGVDQRQAAEAEIPMVRGSSETAMQLADVFLSASLPDDALKALAFVAPTAKRDGHFYYLEGKAFRQRGQLQPALRDFSQALVRDPQSLPTLIALAEIYSVQGNHAESAQMLAKAHNLDPPALPVLRHLVMEEMQAGEKQAAVDAATTLQSQSKDSSDQYLLATALIEAEEYDAAAPVLRAYLGQNPRDARAMLGLGMVYIHQRSYLDARKVLEQALATQPDFPEVEYNLAIVAKEEGRTDEAIQYLEKSLSQKVNNATAWFELGSLYLERGNLEKAEDALTRSLNLDSNGIQAEYNLGLVLSKLGKTEEAKQHMQRYQQLLKVERAREEQKQAKHATN